jgi:site-specific DNA-methyltransferase (adenine-specific)
LIDLYKSNCLEILRQLPNNSIDHIITDPPYNIGYADWDVWPDIEEITFEWYRVLKDDGSVFCFSGWSFVCEVIQKFDKRFKLNDWIIYDRIKGRGAKKRLVSTREDILWYIKGENCIFNKDLAYSTIKKKTGGLGLKNGRDTRALSNVWTDCSPIVPWSKEKVDHSTQKPLFLMERIIKVFTNEEDLILDCYMGSGTTGVACKKLNRSFIGIEKEEKYFNIAKERIYDN